MERLRERLIAEMRGVFGADARRIDHALAVLGYAERILAAEGAAEGGADAETVTAAAILHDIGILEAERKHGSSAGHWQELEGPPIARVILERQGLPEEKLAHVCRIVGAHHSARGIDTPEFRIVWDADWLVNLPELRPEAEARQATAAQVMKTAAGAKLAREEL